MKQEITKQRTMQKKQQHWTQRLYRTKKKKTKWVNKSIINKQNQQKSKNSTTIILLNFTAKFDLPLVNRFGLKNGRASSTHIMQTVPKLLSSSASYCTTFFIQVNSDKGLYN